MKKMLFIAIALATLSFIPATNELSKKERKGALQLLKSTEKDLTSVLKGLDEAQLKYKPAPDRWSIEECVIHIATTEDMLWQMTDAAIKQPANPDKRAEIKVTDEQIVKMVEDRSEKRKTFTNLQPENSKYKTAAEALEAFKTSRANLENYIKSTSDDLRNHVVALQFGQVDSYQMILFMAGHTNRHTNQIKEVMADAGYPKAKAN
ncbi:DinB family protein [Paraflavitalea sp. CAU 1676]|uniref:DinB family protein n=1 Tax=Paraflavitalea sp. CAU 1676 TaxID=3032598 RepID=UPI0023DC20D3|nr:DinB family protein [Paraflavitalea sp. CAU 1676]MDF2187963.1 DinB family protein [Paraflavitalea sp. CAU 1676]